ncbi:zinc finger protein 845 [Caerostris extrusa]|uniref:Zinc finger protein 845 n=1 Tax=Caerostris extrusa TaxID=172846 RepID=A0AAV4YCX3_CAEEX|nr:zinc finger protein 845 [Caerostris extrusa]
MICEFCNEEFIGKRGAFMKHVHSHTPEVCGICDERFVDRQSLREHCKIHVGTAEGKMFMECSQKALDAKNGLLPPEPKVEYIYLVLR